MIETELWSWEIIGTNQGPGFMGSWQAHALVAEGPLGWYAAGEGHKTGPDYVYRLPGRLAPSGPHTRSIAEGIARQMIGLAADASSLAADQLVIFVGPAAEGRKDTEGQDVTGGRWALESGGDEHACVICGQEITGGWTEGPWKNARRFICVAHVETRSEARPIQQGMPLSARATRMGRRYAPANLTTSDESASLDG